MFKKLFQKSEPAARAALRTWWENDQKSKCEMDTFCTRGKAIQTQINALEDEIVENPLDFTRAEKLIELMNERDRVNDGLNRFATLTHEPRQRLRCASFVPVAKDALQAIIHTLEDKLVQVRKAERDTAEELGLADASDNSPTVQAINAKLSTARQHLEKLNKPDFSDWNSIKTTAAFCLED